jgi:G3E family GTPase
MKILSEDDDRARMPVAIVSGYLGSGKTTLINRLLADPRLADTAVAVNEFGEVPLDQHLVEHDADRVVTLANGCLCCNLAGDLEDAVLRLFARRQEGKIPDFSRLIIEPTGLANPVPLAQALLRNPMMSKIFRLETVLVTVDALLGAGQIARHEEVVRQVRLAEVILLTKTDLASAEQVATIRGLLARHNPAAPIVAVVNGEVHPAEIFPPGFLSPQDGTPRLLQLDQENGAEHHHHDHEAAESEPPIVVHGVEHVLHAPVRLSAWPDSNQSTCLVFVLAPDAPNILVQSWNDLVA